MSKYFTVDKNAGCLDYRTIADKMTESGDKMNHSTARNIFMSGIQKIVKNVFNELDMELSDEDLKEYSRNPEVQESLFEFFADIYDRKER